MEQEPKHEWSVAMARQWLGDWDYPSQVKSLALLLESAEGKRDGRDECARQLREAERLMSKDAAILDLQQQLSEERKRHDREAAELRTDRDVLTVKLEIERNAHAETRGVLTDPQAGRPQFCCRHERDENKRLRTERDKRKAEAATFARKLGEWNHGHAPYPCLHNMSHAGPCEPAESAPKYLADRVAALERRVAEIANPFLGPLRHLSWNTFSRDTDGSCRVRSESSEAFKCPWPQSDAIHTIPKP
jgi:hypothetical protein